MERRGGEGGWRVEGWRGGGVERVGIVGLWDCGIGRWRSDEEEVVGEKWEWRGRWRRYECWRNGSIYYWYL